MTRELAARGYTAVDTDHGGLSELVDVPSGVPTIRRAGRSGPGMRAASSPARQPAGPPGVRQAYTSNS
ncbi:MAG: hypothetical protein V7603_2717 [Micromonosporaceae bacterium]